MLQNPKGEQPQSLVELKGYVSPSTPEVVRIYWDLTLLRYFDIPRSAIVQQLQGQDVKNDPATLYVRSSAAITSASNVSADVAAAQHVAMNNLKKVTPLGGGAKADAGVCVVYYARCLLGSGIACVMASACADGALQ